MPLPPDNIILGYGVCPEPKPTSKEFNREYNERMEDEQYNHERNWDWSGPYYSRGDCGDDCYCKLCIEEREYDECIIAECTQRMIYGNNGPYNEY